MENEAWRIVCALIGKELRHDQKIQIQLPTPLAGCQMPMPTHTVPLARAANLARTSGDETPLKSFCPLCRVLANHRGVP